MTVYFRYEFKAKYLVNKKWKEKRSVELVNQLEQMLSNKSRRAKGK